MFHGHEKIHDFFIHVNSDPFFSLALSYFLCGSCLSFNLEITMSFVTCIWMMVASLVISRNGLSSCHLQMVRFHCFEKKRKLVV